MNRSACQKLGRAAPPSAMNVPNMSILLPGRSAEMIATDSPSTIPKSSPARPTLRLVGTRRPSTSATGSPVRIDLPRSPWTVRQSQRPYWT